jgi:voltage-gated potassium channel
LIRHHQVVSQNAPVGLKPGEPRSEASAHFIRRFDDAMRLPIVVSAVLPLIVVPESAGWLGVVVEAATWVVFLVDYLVHSRHLSHYARTGFGRFDLLVVVATAPWFLFPGAQAGRFVVLLRLARLARLALASKGARRLFERLGRVALVAGGVVLVASLVAYYAERATNPEFATFGDSMWWGIVTLTTVGYGDIVPHTATGRWAGVVIMVTGVAVLGLLSGSLASFFRLNEKETGAPGDSATPTSGAAATTQAVATRPPADMQLDALTTELTALRGQVEALGERIVTLLSNRTQGEPPPGEDPPG